MSQVFNQGGDFMKRYDAYFVCAMYGIILFCCSALVFAASEPYSVRANQRSASYMFMGTEPVRSDADRPQKPGPYSSCIESNSDSRQIQVGVTYYDQQQNCTMGRQIEHRNSDYLHMAWTQDNGSRGIAYQRFNLSECDFEFAAGGIVISSSLAGYVSLDVNPYSGNSILSAHEDDVGQWRPTVYFDMMPPFCIFGLERILDYNGAYSNPPNNVNIWPKIDWQVGTETVLHMVATEYPANSGGVGPMTASYYRRVGPYGIDSGIWSSQRLIDTITTTSVTVTSSPISDRVAIVWMAPCDYKRDTPTEFDHQFENDLWYALSDDQGLSWTSPPNQPSIGHSVDQGIGGGYQSGVGGNITHYTEQSNWKAYCDLSALFAVYDDGGETQDRLHIVWGSRYWPPWKNKMTCCRAKTQIQHWRENWTNPGTAVMVFHRLPWNHYIYPFSGNAAKMTLSQCDDKLYVVYSQFPEPPPPPPADVASNDYVNAELMITGSTNWGSGWGEPVNLTGTSTPSCNPDYCASEYWPSAARYGRIDDAGCHFPGEPVLDILYVQDVYPDRLNNHTNGIKWLPIQCFTPESRPSPILPDITKVLDSLRNEYGYASSPFIRVQPGHEKTIPIVLTNHGMSNNPFAATIEYNNASDWLDFTPSSGLIPANGGTFSVDLILTAPPDTLDPLVLQASIIIDHDGWDGGLDTIPINMLISSEDLSLDSAIVSTDCKRLAFFNNGQLSNNTLHASLDYIDDCDTFNVHTDASIYLYNGTPLIAGTAEFGPFRYMAYPRNYFDFPDTSEKAGPGDFCYNAFIPQSSVTVDDTSFSDYTYVYTNFITPDTAITILSEYFVPKQPQECEFVVHKLQFSRIGGSEYYDFKVGGFWDWDVPSDSGVRNWSGYDSTRNLIYQQGAEYNQDDDTEALCPQESDDRFAGIAVAEGIPFENAMTIKNETYVYTTGPFGPAAPMPADTVYGLMSGTDGFVVADIDSATDLSTIITYGGLSMYHDNAYFLYSLVTSKTGLNDLLTAVDSANAFIATHPDIRCDCIPGDANGDCQANVGDAVYIINYVFKGGPAPVPYEICSGDANGDCQANVGDAVYLINYVFKSGPPPISCHDWVSACGSP